MVLTNLLINLSFTVLTNFPAADRLSAKLPATLDESARIVVGSPYSATEVHFFQKDGSIFGIRDGAVIRIETKGSFFHSPDLSQPSVYFGASKETRASAGAIGRECLEKLSHAGAFAIGAPNNVVAAKKFGGKPIPFFIMDWRENRGPDASDMIANLELDGRTGKIVHLELWDRKFADLPTAHSISNATFIPEYHPRKPDRRDERTPLMPPAEATAMLAQWTDTLSRLGAVVTHPKLSDIRWDKSATVTNSTLAGGQIVHYLHLEDGATLTYAGGMVVAGSLPGSFMGADRTEPDDMKALRGTVRLKWEDLANRFEDRLKSFGIKRSELKGAEAGPYLKPSAVDQEGLCRACIDWRIWPSHWGTISIDESILVFSVEFDLTSGEIKSFAFNSPDGNRLVKKLMSASRVRP